jgi:hypothetical protein
MRAGLARLLCPSKADLAAVVGEVAEGPQNETARAVAALRAGGP